MTLYHKKGTNIYYELDDEWNQVIVCDDNYKITTFIEDNKIDAYKITIYEVPL